MYHRDVGSCWRNGNTQLLQTACSFMLPTARSISSQRYSIGFGHQQCSDTLCSYLSVCGPPVSLHDSCHSPVTSLVMSCFHQQDCCWLDVCFFEAPFLVNAGHCRVWKVQEGGCFWDSGSGAPGTGDHTSLSRLGHLFYPFWCSIKQELNVSACLSALYSKP